MQCPKCDAKMRVVMFDGVEVDRCESCEGIWFDLREHDRLVKEPNAKRLDTGDPARGKQTNAIRDIDCPRCGVEMVPIAFPDQPHIDYEQCSTCGGAFLDAGEFADLAELTLTERLTLLFGSFRKKPDDSSDA